MIIEYDKSPGISAEERLRSLAESVMRALDEQHREIEGLMKQVEEIELTLGKD